MDQRLIFLIILAMAVVTYLPRFLPIFFLSGKRLHPLLVSWLKLVVPAVLSAMLVPTLIIRDDMIDLGLRNLYLWVGIVTFFIAWRTKSLSFTVLMGMAMVAFGRYLGLGG